MPQVEVHVPQAPWTQRSASRRRIRVADPITLFATSTTVTQKPGSVEWLLNIAAADTLMAVGYKAEDSTFPHGHDRATRT